MAKTRIILDDRKLQQIKAAIADKKPDRWLIHDGVEYGIYIELGTSRMAERPSLIPALETTVKIIPDVLGQAIENAVDINDVLAKLAFDIQALWVHNITALPHKPKPPIDTNAFRASIKASKQ